MTEGPAQTLVLQEFRLSAVDTDGAVARIVGAAPAALGPTMPLLTSIDDRHDVATIRLLRDGEPDEVGVAQRAGLDRFVSSWLPTKYYLSQIAERSQSPPTHYRLAVTESGINDEVRDPPSAGARGGAPDDASSPVDLLWIGHSPTSHAGLLVLLGDHDDPESPRRDPRVWPLAMSRGLGVRIYDSAATYDSAA